MSELHADLLVIGWGKAGKSLAKRLAAAGKHVVLIERSREMVGGSCINVACVPTKALVVSAQRRRDDDDPVDYFAASVEARDALIRKLNAANRAMLEGTVTLIDGQARFVSAHTVVADTAEGEVRVTAERIVVGTGTVPARPDLPGSDLPRVYDSTTIQHATPLPARLAIVGAGFIGLEFAGMFAQFGSQVTVLNRSERLLAKVDGEVAAEVERVLAGQGVEFRHGASVTAIEPRDGDELELMLDGGGAVRADAVLLAVGRTPVTEGLELAAAGIDTDERGFIVVDDQLRTSVPEVWAVGDVNGGPQFTYISYDDYRIVSDQLLGSGARSRADRVAVPTTTFITPPFAQVGQSAAEAVAAGHSVLVATKRIAEIAAMPRPKILGQTEGLMQFVVDADSRAILGATLFCVDAQELINLVALAMRLGATADDLRDGIWTHPSSTEAFNEVLAELAPHRGE